MMPGFPAQTQLCEVLCLPQAHPSMFVHSVHHVHGSLSPKPCLIVVPAAPLSALPLGHGLLTMTRQRLSTSVFVHVLRDVRPSHPYASTHPSRPPNEL